MTSFTKSLFARNPGAAKELRRAQLHQLRYGKDVTLAQFHIERDDRMQAAQRQCMQGQPTFGRRVPSGLSACAANCGHPACLHGCTLIGSINS